MPLMIVSPDQTSPEIHVGDVGTQIIVTVYNQLGEVQNLSTVTEVLYRLFSPLQVSKEFVGALLTDGLDGKVVYTLSSGDIDKAGYWKFQCVLIFPDGTWSTNVEDMIVYENIPAPVVP